MSIDDSDEETVTFPVDLDLKTVGRLMALARVCADAPAKIIASIVHDVLEDDARQNAEVVERRSCPLH